MHGSDLKKIHPSDPMHAWLQITRAASQPARGRLRASPVVLTAIYIQLRARIIEHFLSGWSGHCARMCPYSNVLLCVHRSCTVHDQNLCQNGTFSSTSDRPALYTIDSRCPMNSKIRTIVESAEKGNHLTRNFWAARGILVCIEGSETVCVFQSIFIIHKFHN